MTKAFQGELYASTRAEELTLVPWSPQAKQQFLVSQFALQHRHYTQAYMGADFLLILRGTEAIGRIYVHRSPGVMTVVDVALVPTQRGQGIGAALFTELLDEARATRCVIELHVEPSNPAQRLYVRLGFSLVEHCGVYDFLRWSVAV